VLAAWFRLKYPHMAIGALASSAPILYFDDITPQDAYYSVVSRAFRVIYHVLILLFSLFISFYHQIYHEKGDLMMSWYMQEASETCYQTILKSWSEIDRVASQPKGLSLLSQKFNTCRYNHCCLNVPL